MRRFVLLFLASCLLSGCPANDDDTTADDDDTTADDDDTAADDDDDDTADDDDTTDDDDDTTADDDDTADEDGDGVNAGVDCDDNDPAVHPFADELCDGFDNDCDDLIDPDDSVDAPTWYADFDDDGYGNADLTHVSCAAPPGFIGDDATDCDDLDPDVHPGADESDCTDPTDFNCDGSTGYADGDGDGYAACEDCDDSDAAAHPGGVEVCDGADNDCDGSTDGEDALGGTPWYGDGDGDGWGDVADVVFACVQPAETSATPGDCDDENSGTYPFAPELCDDEDDNCNGLLDDDAIDAVTWYADLDGDGEGNASLTEEACDAPAGYLATGDDCDDLDDAAYPGAEEICGDGLDQDCDGSPLCDGGTVDSDGDDWSDEASGGDDCDDTDATVFPGAPELCDTIDQDCDGLIICDGGSTDADGDAYSAEGDDCDDGEPTVYPGAPELCDGLDNGCDGGLADPGFDDLDGDDIADCVDDDVDGDGADSTADCDDGDPSIFPGADEVCDGVDQDCGGDGDLDGGVNVCLYGDGRDGDVVMTDGNLSTDILGSARVGSPDGVATPVTADPTASTLLSVDDSVGFAPGDMALLLNLQGGPGDVDDVGNWEVVTVEAAPSGDVIELVDATVNNYGGADFAAQAVVLQRIPQWSDVTITGTLTASPWDGDSGGVLAFFALGTVAVQGAIDMSSAGYRGGAGQNINGPGEWTNDGEGRTGVGAAGNPDPNDCGGGGAFGLNSLYNGNSGGGAYATRDPGPFGDQGNGSISGVSGDVVGDADLVQLNLGGAGGGCINQNGPIQDGGFGGGIIFIRATALDIAPGFIRSDGQDGFVCPGGDPSNNAGGAGGAIYVVAQTLTGQSGGITAEGGDAASNSNNGQGAAGGDGRIRLEYATLNGSPYPAPGEHEAVASPDPGATSEPGS